RGEPADRAWVGRARPPPLSHRCWVPSVRAPRGLTPPVLRSCRSHRIVPVPVPLRVCECGSGYEADPCVAKAGDVSGGSKSCKAVAEAFVAHVEGGTELGTGEAFGGRAVECVKDGGVDVGGGRSAGRLGYDDGEVHVALCTDEGERNRLRHTGSAVFDGEDELLAETAQGEGRIDPGKEVTGPAQALASGGVATVFACMVDDRDSEVVGALQLAQISKDGSYVTGLVLVDAMEPYEGVKEEQTRRFATHGLVKAALVVRKVEAY